MPPSGFNQKAIMGLTTFIEACYEDLLVLIKSGLGPEEAIQKELEDIRSYMKSFDLANSE